MQTATVTDRAYPLRVYYDRSCPVCRAEIHALKAEDHRERLQLVDCSAEGFTDDIASRDGKSQQAMMKAIHVVDAQGRWHTAADAFAAIYAAAGIERMARFWAAPSLRPLLDRIYPLMAYCRPVLSVLGLHRLIGWFTRRAARRAAERSGACRIDAGPAG
jgi:predicted DCC family thiol-disulfide oxidoreductase YuxK